MKKIILLLIDSLMSKHLEAAKEANSIPALQYLISNGLYNDQCVTVFPTMTAPIDASLITGAYPDQHKIPGLIWYSSKEKRLINYMNGSGNVLKLGINSAIEDLLININELHLSKHVKTIFEELSDNKKTAASINFIAHRGREKHQPDFPFLSLILKVNCIYNPIKDRLLSFHILKLILDTILTIYINSS